MSDLLAIGLSGVKAYGKALETVGDNVANASTPGHVRRTVTLATNPIGGGMPAEFDRRGGNGVRLTSIDRAVDELRMDSLRRSEADVGALDAADRWVDKLQALLTGASALDDPMTSFFTATSNLATDPANLAVRATFLAQADMLADRFNASAEELSKLTADIGMDGATETAKLNTLFSGLAAVNGQMRRTSPGSAAAAALQDERDRLLSQAATYTSIDVRLDERGQATVRIPDAGGPLVVDGNRSEIVRLTDAPSGGFQLRVGPSGNDEPAAFISGSIAGISIAARMVAETSGRLDALADRIAGEMNAVHQSGVDLNGDRGIALFGTLKPVATAMAGNGGSARVAVELDDGAPPPDLRLTFNGHDWTLVRTDGTASTTGGLPLTLDGATVEAHGTPRNGDVFAVTAVLGAAGMHLNTLSNRQVAAAPPFLSEPSGANQGDARIHLDGGTSLGGTGPYTVIADGAGNVELTDSLGTVLGAGPAGSWIAGDGFSFRIEGTPAEADSFVIRATGPDTSANDNAVALQALRLTGGATGTYADAQDATLTAVSVPLSEMRARLAVATAARDTAAEALNEASGVSLDSEAADMLRLQQAYSANARIIQTAREIFETILNAAR